jgi:hypothetical protein
VAWHIEGSDAVTKSEAHERLHAAAIAAGWKASALRVFVGDFEHRNATWWAVSVREVQKDGREEATAVEVHAVLSSLADATNRVLKVLGACGAHEKGGR